MQDILLIRTLFIGLNIATAYANTCIERRNFDTRIVRKLILFSKDACNGEILTFTQY